MKYKYIVIILKMFELAKLNVLMVYLISWCPQQCMVICLKEIIVCANCLHFDLEKKENRETIKNTFLSGLSSTASGILDLCIWIKFSWTL
jgi:hypothetical protein